MKFKGKEVEEPSEDKILRLFKGKGTITFNDIDFECSFMFWQTIYGDLRGQLAEFNESCIDNLMRHNHEFDEGSFTGTDDSNLSISCERIWNYGLSSNYGKEGSDFLMKVGTYQMEIRNPKVTTSGFSGIFLEVGLLNLNLKRVLIGHSLTDLGKIHFIQLEGHEDIIERAKLSKESIITSFARIQNDQIDEANLDSYLTNLEKVVQKFCKILSIAKTTFVDYTSINIFLLQPDSDKMMFMKELLFVPKKRKPSYTMPLIEDLADFYSFIEHGMTHYTDELIEIYNFDVAVEWYIDGASGDVVQMDFLEICVFLETLKYRHAIHTNRTTIMEDENFKDFSSELVSSTREILCSMGYSGDENSHVRAAFYNHINGMNRWSFNKSIGDLLLDLNLKYEDIITDLSEISKNRNLIVHRGIESDPSEPTNIFEILRSSIALSQRIILALLKYEGYFLDSKHRFARKKFTDYLEVQHQDTE